MQPNPNIGMLQFVPLLFIIGVFYFIVLRPYQKKQKEHQQMIANLKKNDEVVTSGGVHGTIVNVKDRTFVVRVDENTKIEVDKNYIAYVKKVRE